ncbi:MAG TPA: hypothetical protein VIF62_04795 [Labilithrix sp.]|jgi:hypothetical protein
MSTCVSAHALLSAIVARLAKDEGDTDEKELAAILGAGCPRADIEAALAKSDSPRFARARASLARLRSRDP